MIIGSIQDTYHPCSDKEPRRGLICVTFRFITMFCGTDNILHNILHVQYECGKYSMEYCWSHITLLQIRVMLCDHLEKKTIVSFMSYNFCISTAIVKLKLNTVALQVLTRQNKSPL